MYSAICDVPGVYDALQQIETSMSYKRKHVSTLQVGYAVAREWIVNANVLSVLIVESLRWHRDDPFNLLQIQQHKQN